MTPHSLRHRLAVSRPGLSLLELLLFLGLLAIVSGAVLTFFLSSKETQIRQKSLIDLERGGIRIMESFMYHVRHSERILDPALGGSGSVLALQVATEDLDPTILGLEDGRFVLIERDLSYDLLDQPFTVSDLVITNTSPSSEHPSASIRFRLTSTSALPGVGERSRDFSAVATAFPDDLTAGNACGCAEPACDGGSYDWQICEEGACIPLSASLQCP